MSTSHDQETSKNLEAGGTAPMPVPPNSSEHEAHAKGEDPTGGDPEFKPKKGTTTGTAESTSK